MVNSLLVLCTVLAPIVEELGKSEKQQSQDDVTPESSQLEIETICKTMCFRSLRKYIISNLSNLAKLREEVPLALKLASNPAKLVLDCFGRFFLQGIKAYYKDSPMIPSRKASVLVLEYFLLMGFDSGEIEDAVKQEAESSAVDWKKRLMTEGGLVKACETDARGLLLLIGCFGIPKVLKYEDIRDLIRAGNVIEISDVLRRSNVLLTKIPGTCIVCIVVCHNSIYKFQPVYPILPLGDSLKSTILFLVHRVRLGNHANFNPDSSFFR